MSSPTAVSTEQVRALREQTGAGIMDCKRALQESGGDVERAVALLRERGLAKAAGKSGRVAREGLIGSYIHHGGRLGVLVEVNCETDFVARTPDFQTLVRDLAVQIAGLSPRWVSRDQIPADELEAKRAELAADAEREGRPADRVPSIVEGRLEKWLETVSLVDQPFRDTEMKVGDLIAEKVALLGENIRVARFSRMAVGEAETAQDASTALYGDDGSGAG